jgi:hypothetical protein
LMTDLSIEDPVWDVDSMQAALERDVTDED